MLEAKSMYFGGDIISASDCNYQTSRELGLICPFCSSAVFIRSQSTRKINNKTQLVRPYFAHYPTGTPDNWDCENRSHTKQGRAEIERIKVKARNQRLKLYNAHLWDMYAEGRGGNIQWQLNKVRSLFGEKWCEQKSVEVRREWAKAISDVYTYIDAAIQDVRNLAEPEHYLLDCDIKLHQAICNEIADFLTTNTSGYAFHKMFKHCLWVGVKLDKMPLNDWRKLPAIGHISAISVAISATPWIELLKERMDGENHSRSVG